MPASESESDKEWGRGNDEYKDDKDKDEKKNDDEEDEEDEDVQTRTVNHQRLYVVLTHYHRSFKQ